MPVHPVQPPTDDLTVADANSAWLALRYRLQASSRRSSGSTIAPQWVESRSCTLALLRRVE